MASLLLHSRCLILPLLLALPPERLEEADFPVRAYVARDHSAVRSGPGPQYYATDQLSRGTPLEIYRREEGGWLAIRPPEGSFSLVSAEHVQMTTRQDTARITDPQAVAWVGTRHGPVENHKWQVQLKVGELVRVLGEQRVRLLEDGELEKTVRIAPPSGEFRWIHNDDVSTRPPQDPDTAVADDQGVPAFDVTEYRLVVEPEPRTDGQAPTADTPERAREAEDESTWRAKIDAAPIDLGGQELAALDRSTVNLEALREAPDPLREVDLQLSLMAALPPEQWDLTPLRRVALERVDSGATALERGRARLLLEKITEFAELQSRHERLRNTGLATSSFTPGNTSRPEGTSGTGPVGSGVGAASGAGAEYDARGTLVPVHSRTGRVPPYALVDGNGQVLKYVSPSPGLNLHRYLGKQIGIVGQRGYLPAIEARHVTAHRVIQLDRHLR